jgi:hypothetical protein
LEIEIQQEEYNESINYSVHKNLIELDRVGDDYEIKIKTK